MWTFTEIGFFSINRTPTGTNLQFRARRKQDLVNLQARFPSECADAKIMTLPHADYRWRLELPPARAAIIMCALTEQIEYRNFKNHLHQTDQEDKLGILHDLWSAMFSYQGEQDQTRKRPAFKPWNETGYGRDARVEEELGWPEDDSDLFPDSNPKSDPPSRAAMQMHQHVAEAQQTGNSITIRKLAGKLGLTQGKTINLCESEGMNINVGFIEGVRVKKHTPGDYTVEE